MASEIFRFMTIRPPQETDPAATTENAIDLNPCETPLISALVEARPQNEHGAMMLQVWAFLRTNRDHFIDSRKKVDARYLAFYDAVARLTGPDFRQRAHDACIRIFDAEPKRVVDDGPFNELFCRVADSIVIAAMLPAVETRVRSLLVSLAKTLGLLQKLATLPDAAPYSQADFHSQLILLPEGIFPLPSPAQSEEDLAKGERERAEQIAAHQAQLLELSDELAANRNAISELLTAFEKSIADPASFTESRARAAAAEPNAPRAGGFTLPDTAANALSAETRATLTKAGIDLARIDVATATSLLERQAGAVANQLYANRSAMRYMVAIGNRLIPSDYLIGDRPTLVEGSSAAPGAPGACPPQPPAATNDEVTVPLEHTHGDARVLGIADLMIVEQELLRYEMGEIAHIENVLKSEYRNRQFRVLSTVERTTLTETEVIDEKSKDLSSTERFELQSESERVINENASTEVGLTVNASYGPSIDATSNFSHTNSTAKQESARAASSFSRETTTRATARVQKRTLERQFVRTVNETEEINKHGFDNKQGQDHITGVYRFVDKVYRAQIVNYGKRLMLEFMVPEPAAFLRYAMARQPGDAITQIKPEPPGFCQNNSAFIPLEPQHIDRDSYLFWVAKYGASDVEPPPPDTLVVSAQKQKGDIPVGIGMNKTKLSSDAFDIPFDDGYSPQCASINVYGETQAGKHQVVVQAQEQQLFYIEPFDDLIAPLPLRPATTGKIPVTINTIGFHNCEVIVTVYCVCTREKFEAWQIKTYNAIMNAYEDLKSRFDNAVETARIRQEDLADYGANPAMNRECERTELKKGCIALLTAQNFETFDAMRRNVAPHGYPEIAFADAQAEGRYIQFFENAFEWGNMTYIFYPYFWGKKDDWVTVSQLSDTDPLYARFLQAGAARVQLPVRPGFETSLMHYLACGMIWFGEGKLVNTTDGIGDPLHLSVLDELKEQLGNQSIEGKGRLSVTHDATKVTGAGTEFTADDENRRIIIRGKTYVINRVVGPEEIELTEKYADATETGARYSLDAKLVGEPWEVRLPTDLVMIDEHDTLAGINEAIWNG